MLADARAPAVLAGAPLAIMLADAGAPAVLADAPLTIMLADARARAPTAVLAFAPLAVVSCSKEGFRPINLPKSRISDLDLTA